MARYGYHASHEQLPPSALRDCVVLAEQAGFTEGMCSDHIAPWSTAQGESGFAWSWLGAALQATRRMPFGTVNAPGQRYHPAIIAQAAATLAEMFPERFWFAVGSGEAVNEHVTGAPWPRKDLRNQRLRECVDVMRALWRGEEVSHDGLVTVDRARLYSLPARPPLVFGAAVSAATARWVGSWADGLITVNAAVEELQPVLDAFREGGGDGKPIRLQVHLSHAATLDEARAVAFDQWGANVVGPPVAWDLQTVEEFDSIAAMARPEQVDALVLLSDDVARLRDQLHDYAELGIEVVYLHSVGKDQRRFLDLAGERLLPELRAGAAAA
jgi:probable non-F420 flavinoid oxidoreductase